VYNVNSNGTLVVGGPPVRAGTTPTAMAVDATGTLLFVANYGSDAIMVFGTSTGTPTLQTSFPVQIPVASGGSGPVALAVAPGNFPCIDNRTITNPVTRVCYALYAANQISGTVTAYDYFLDSGGTFVRGSIDLNGNFTVGGTVAGSPYSAGTNPSGLAFSRCAGVTSSTRGTACAAGDGNNLFVANSGSDNISIFAACIQLETCHLGESSPDGTLFPVGSPVAAGSGPTTVLVNGSADFVYVVDSGSNQISEYQYAPFTGALAPIGVTSASSTPLLFGAITPGWVVAASNGALSSYQIGSDGTLTAPASGQGTIQGQPSAILIR
jgi:DNA-binding beta-propeller fold protein YncE